MEKKKKHGNPVLLIAIVILVLVFLYSGLQVLESTVFDSDQDSGDWASRTITRNGVDYYPRQDITVVMLAGIDEEGPVESSGSYNNNGEADMVMLLIFDETSEKLDILSLNRDTMLTVPVLGIGGRQAGTIYGQLALAHTYGTGLEDSCENLEKAVSDFLYGLNINYYAVMNMDGIAILNDQVGGVTVNVTDDFSQVDPSLTKGTHKLSGKQAISYVRARGQVGNQLNLSRMARQEEYMSGFLTALRSNLDSGFILSAYDKVSPYMTTDCSGKSMAALADRYSGYELGQIYTIPGENAKGDVFMEYHVDTQALDELILNLFYAPKQPSFGRISKKQ